MSLRELPNLKAFDSEIYQVVEDETNRQREHLELIASENFISEPVMEALGTTLNNKYAEGYPAKRYYGGCEFVDVSEDLARKRLCKLFGADHANVQPHSGANANIGVYFAVLKPGDKVLGMNLSEGGHLTHGSPVNFSGQSYDMYAYGLDPETEQIDYDKLEEIAREVKPKMIIAGASAYSREIDFERIGKVAKEVGAIYMVDMAHIAGLVATGEHPNPVPFADVVTSTTHKTLRGPRGGLILAKKEHAKALNKTVFPGIQGGPLEHVIAAKAVAFNEALQPAFKDYAKQVKANAKAMAEVFEDSPLHIISNGTDNHLMLIDVTGMGITGKWAQERLDKVAITVNKNSIPNDTQSFVETSGIRVGTPAITTRGIKEDEARVIAKLIIEALQAEESELESIKQRVHDMMDGRPLFNQ